MTAACHNLLHIFPSFGLGGVPIRICDIVNRLGPDYRHTFVAMDGCLGAANRLDAQVDASLESLALSRYSLFGNVKACRALAHKVGPDLLLTYNWGATEFALANLMGRRIPHIHFESGFGPEEADGQLRRRIAFRRLALGQAYRIVVPSKTLFSIASEIWGVPPARLLVIPNGVDCQHYTGIAGERIDLSTDDKSAEFVVGTVAPLRPEKNVGRLIKIFAAWDHLPAHLVIAGDGPERSKLEALANSLGLAQRITFLGHRDDVPQVLRSFDVFALTSDTEQMPNSLLQAMAAGRPVLATNVGDVAHILPSEGQTFVYSKDDLGPPADGLGRLADNPELRSCLGQANQSHVRATYGFDKMVASYQKLFFNAIKSSDPAFEETVRINKDKTLDVA